MKEKIKTLAEYYKQGKFKIFYVGEDEYKKVKFIKLAQHIAWCWKNKWQIREQDIQDIISNISNGKNSKIWSDCDYYYYIEVVQEMKTWKN